MRRYVDSGGRPAGAGYETARHRAKFDEGPFSANVPLDLTLDAPATDSCIVRTMTENVVGTATVLGTVGPSLRADGPCLAGTLQGLMMPAATIEKIKHDALDLLARVVAVYVSEIAAGEVGAEGSGKANTSVPAKPCTGLLYGRIQSGKTVAMIGLVAAAIDNGFRVIVVLTSDNLKLVSQTTDRFGALDGPIAIDALRKGWASDHKHIGKHLAQSAVVFVCSKNTKRLDELIAGLEQIGAPNYPALILDDEADQATLDTNLAKSSRAQSKGSPALDPTAIYARVVTKLSRSLRHHVFLQVTATPYALLLQTVGTKLRPSFMRLLEPGMGYTGGEHFFEAAHLEGPTAPLVYVADDESTTIVEGADAPDGLRQAIAFFLVAAAAQIVSDPERAKAGQNFLCHTSQLRTQHRVLEVMVRDYVDRLGDHLGKGAGEGADRIQRAYADLLRTFADAPALEAIIEQVKRKLVGRRIVVVNAEADAEPGKGLNFIIGGNILGRGVTIENLLVTYYLREPKTGQMDTTLQHARMYGYRGKLMHLTRVFLPQPLAVRFHEIHCIERRLRRQLAAADMGRPIVIEKAAHLKPTRNTVLDPSYIDAFDAEEQIFPLYPDFRIKSVDYDRISAWIQKLVGRALSTDALTASIDYDELLALVDDFPYDGKQGSTRWLPGVLRRVLEKQRERCHGRAFIYTREMKRKTKVFATGALAGDELRELRSKGGPVFCAFRDDGSRIRELVPPANRFWYPTLVLDHQMPSLIVNTTPDGS